MQQLTSHVKILLRAAQECPIRARAQAQKSPPGLRRAGLLLSKRAVAGALHQKAWL
jgi:hypothetical protein